MLSRRIRGLRRILGGNCAAQATPSVEWRTSTRAEFGRIGPVPGLPHRPLALGPSHLRSKFELHPIAPHGPHELRAPACVALIVQSAVCRLYMLHLYHTESQNTYTVTVEIFDLSTVRCGSWKSRSLKTERTLLAAAATADGDARHFMRAARPP